MELASNSRHEDVCRESVESESRVEETALILRRGVTRLKGSGPVLESTVKGWFERLPGFLPSSAHSTRHFVRDESGKAAGSDVNLDGGVENAGL